MNNNGEASKGTTDLQKSQVDFYNRGSNFFAWNSGKNTPNILANLSANLEKCGNAMGTLEGTINKTGMNIHDSLQALTKVMRESSFSSSNIGSSQTRIIAWSLLFSSLFSGINIIIQVWLSKK